MKEITVWAKIIKYERLNNTYVGNPMYKILVETKDDTFYVKTAVNSQVAYKFSPTMIGSAMYITYHATKAGNYILTDIRDKRYWTVWYEIGCSNDRYYFKDREEYKAFCIKNLGYTDEYFKYDCERYLQVHYRDEKLRSIMHILCNIVNTEEELMLGE